MTIETRSADKTDGKDGLGMVAAAPLARVASSSEGTTCSDTIGPDAEFLPITTVAIEDDGPHSSSCCCCNCCSGRRCCDRFRNGWKMLKEELEEPLEDMTHKGKQFAKKSLTLKTVKNFFPITNWITKYRCRHLQGDFIGGLTVGVTVIPQGLAYAVVAGLPPEYGLYSAFMGCFIYMFLGTSKDITLGPTAIMSLMTATFAKSPIPNDPTYAIILSFIGGIIQLLMGLTHIGFVVDYISHPVINSFTTAAAITIAWGQIDKWLGLKDMPRDFLGEIPAYFINLHATRIWDFLMGLSCILALYGMKKMRSIKWGSRDGMSTFVRALKYVVWLLTTARNAIVVILASIVALIFLQNGLKPFNLTGYITPGLPKFKVPKFTLQIGDHEQSASETFAALGAGLIIVPLMGVIETIAIGKAFARKGGYTIEANQELLAIGLSNVLGSFVGCYPVTGSFSRTAVNAQSGVMTPAGGIFTAVLVLLALAFLTPLFYYIPKAALAAVIIMAVIDMIDFSLLKKLWRIKKLDLIPWLITFFCCLGLGIEYGIIIGVGISLLLLLYPWARPHIHFNFIQVTNDEMMVMTLNQGLLFPGIEHFKDKIYDKALSGTNTKSVVLDFTYISNTDFTAVEGMHQLLEDFAKKKRKLILCNLRPDILEVFLKARLKNFAHAGSVDEAIELLKGDGPESTSESSADVASSAEAVDLPELLDTPDIERRSIYDDEDADGDEDQTDDEALDKNYIVTTF